MLECDVPGGDNTQIPEEDSGIAFLLGQRLQVSFNNSIGGRNSWAFPANMASESLYPESSSLYTTKDGTEHAVSCFIPKEASDAAQADCPFPFVNPVDQGNIKPCVQACPVAAYSDEEYSAMWTPYVVVGTVGFLLNIFVVCTWALGKKKEFQALPFQLKFCVFAGIAFFLVGTLPVLMLKYDLPCFCETEECYGTSALCAINRSSTYILLSILVNLRSRLCFCCLHILPRWSRKLMHPLTQFCLPTVAPLSSNCTTQSSVGVNANQIECTLMP
jgi:hypothetical protein